MRSSELLERLVQRIFTAGLLLHDASGGADPPLGLGDALDELDAALNAIRGAARSWLEPEGSRSAPTRALPSLGRAIDLLDDAAASLDQLVTRGPTSGDGIAWMAANDAGHMVCRALIVLRHAATEGSDSDGRRAIRTTQPV